MNHPEQPARNRASKSLSAVCLLALGGATPALAEAVQFNRDIRPILSENCFQCHGPDKGHRKADLRLDVREIAIGSKAIAPGKPEASELVERVFATDADDLMPPPKSHKKLTDRQRSLLKQWIVEGAEYQPHWSYIPATKPAVAAGVNAVDYLVRERLKTIGLQPSPEADRRTLIRRLSFDLVGLPPKPEEVDAFINDKAADAYERLVERLLSSPHYGERMAMGWLDVVRFADTIGYHSDNPRNVWPYRDYVIKSFNDNKPYDRFTLEQLAGDLLPEADQEQKVGSAFNRLILTTQEGGAQPKDYEARYLTDRVRAVGAVWLGQTLGCCQCHDHKFDPATTRDFYSMGAFFADIEEGIVGAREEGMVIADATQQEKLKKLDADLAAAGARLAPLQPAMDAALKQWEADLRLYKITLPELEKDSAASDADRKQAQKVTDILKKEGKRRSADDEVVSAYFFAKVNNSHAAERNAVAAAQAARDELFRSLPKCLVSNSSKAPRTVRILPRGNWQDASGELVSPALPVYLAGNAKPSADRRLTRLDLAQWIVSRENPLTARVFVNRTWKQFFGGGLCKQLDDFGAQGEPPVNPALLDWLACDFMEHAWDIKQLVRALVMSATYRQSSSAAKELMVSDPYNRELARQSRFRLDAELVRDDALSIAGLLILTIGGPSVKPYQPEGYWENLNFPTRTYQNDSGESQHRRGLYTWWQRSYLHPSLLAFDAPTREECAAERTRSNIPQQALVLLNDPTYIEAAREFAARIIRHGGGDAAARIAWAWRQALAREPRDDEAVTARELMESNLVAYEKDAPAAAALLHAGIAPMPEGVPPAELAAWTSVARLILNLHETITRN